jgi:GTPase SAR1 family protein
MCIIYIYYSLILVKIGVDFALKVIDWDKDALIRLQLWDIAGI